MPSAEIYFANVQWKLGSIHSLRWQLDQASDLMDRAFDACFRADRNHNKLAMPAMPSSAATNLAEHRFRRLIKISATTDRQ